MVLDNVFVRRKEVPALRPEAGRVEDLLAHKHHVKLRIKGHIQQHVRAAQLEARPSEWRVCKLTRLHACKEALKGRSAGDIS